ncbi:MAG: chemotaxis protein [Burkholderiales bacterium]|nr:chemotaxis protein [Burkholderiales bacterium]
MGAHDNHLLRMIDDKTRLAGSNRMELLLFSVSDQETFGINVFKVREVCEMIAPTPAPNLPSSVEGLISLRGNIIPVFDLALCLDVPRREGPGKLIVTEFSGHTQAFHVGDVDRIVRVDWTEVKAPRSVLMQGAGLVTAVTELPPLPGSTRGRLVSILDVEQILSNVIGEEAIPRFDPVEDEVALRSVFFADDSSLARKRITEVLDGLKVAHNHAVNGAEAWTKLRAQADAAQASGTPLHNTLGLILLDAEMPEMDGYVLTRNIKSDRRFDGIPVVMHSSLSSVANQKLGQQVGVDAYVPKFKPDDLAQAIRRMLQTAPLQGA